MVERVVEAMAARPAQPAPDTPLLRALLRRAGDAYDRYGDWMRGIVGPSAVEQMGALTRAMTEGWQRGERGLPEGAGDVAGMLDFTGPIGGLAGVIRRLPLDDFAAMRYNTALSGRTSDAAVEQGSAQGAGGLSAVPAEGAPPGVGRSVQPDNAGGAGYPLVIGDGGVRSLGVEDARGIAGRVANYREVPRRQLGGDYGRVTSRPGETPDFQIANDLKPKALDETLRHELGHIPEALNRYGFRAAFDELKPAEAKALLREMQRASAIERPDAWTRAGRVTSEGRRLAADTRAELYADAQARYAADPEAMKRDFPNAAAFVRRIWNGNPKLAQEMTFNEFAAAMIGGGLLASALGGEGGGS